MSMDEGSPKYLVEQKDYSLQIVLHILALNPQYVVCDFMVCSLFFMAVLYATFRLIWLLS